MGSEMRFSSIFTMRSRRPSNWKPPDVSWAPSDVCSSAAFTQGDCTCKAPSAFRLTTAPGKGCQSAEPVRHATAPVSELP
ncbi:hypothetical protein D3C72_2470530 [compost metagenome]